MEAWRREGIGVLDLLTSNFKRLYEISKEMGIPYCIRLVTVVKVPHLRRPNSVICKSP